MFDTNFIRQQIAERLNSWVALRRHFHQFPELSGEERQTAAYVADVLRNLGLDVTTNIGGYGISAILHGVKPGPLLAYRADMDALPIQDTLDKSYAPLELGIKHACGHDVHMTIALATAELLTGLRRNLHGAVQFIFQPGEESLDGAHSVLADGLFEAQSPAAIYALHAFPLPVGTIALRKGACLAGMQEWRVRIYAPAGNLSDVQRAAIPAIEGLSTVSQPHSAKDFESVFQQMRTASDFDAVQFLSCWENGYSVADASHLMILVSLTDFDARLALRAQLHAVLTEVCATYGASFDLNLAFENAPLINDVTLIDSVAGLADTLFGSDRVWRFQTPYPFAHEDFALYSAYAPTAFIWLGTANAKSGIASILHTADYDVDEQAIAVGAELMTHILLAHDVNPS